MSAQSAYIKQQLQVIRNGRSISHGHNTRRLPGLFRPLQKLFDICFNVDGEEPSAVSLERFSVRADEELLKVPGDVIPVHRTPDDEFGISHQGHGVVTGLRQLLLEEHKQRVGVHTVHFQLLQKLEIWLEAISRTDVLQGQQNFIILGVLLMSELVAGSAQDHEPLISVAAVELVHLGVIPDCCTSKRRHIFNKHHFTFERGKIEDFPCQKFGGQIIKLLRGPCHHLTRRLLRRSKRKVMFYQQTFS